MQIYEKYRNQYAQALIKIKNERARFQKELGDIMLENFAIVHF